jgi:hypothetical protein
MWSCRALSVAVACLLSGILLNLKFLQNGKRKVLTFALAKLIVCACLIVVPFVNDFVVLLLGKIKVTLIF